MKRTDELLIFRIEADASGLIEKMYEQEWA